MRCDRCDCDMLFKAKRDTLFNEKLVRRNDVAAARLRFVAEVQFVGSISVVGAYAATQFHPLLWDLWAGGISGMQEVHKL